MNEAKLIPISINHEGEEIATLEVPSIPFRKGDKFKIEGGGLDAHGVYEVIWIKRTIFANKTENELSVIVRVKELPAWEE